MSTPVRAPESASTIATAASMAPVTTAVGRLAGLRLLIIDDLRDNAEAMGELLRYEGADVAIQMTASDAIKHAHNERFDAIISDLAMPDMDGYAMLKELRSAPLNAKTPAIAYSGYGGPDETARSKAAGFQLHLTKPVDVDRLLDSINSITPSVAERVA